MEPRSSISLVWPDENARPIRSDAARLDVPGSNLALDLHGDPMAAQLVVFSDGNHHMALEDVLQLFLANHPDAIDVCYLTTPPRVIMDALKSGVVACGNLRLGLKPHVFISPDDVLAKLAQTGQVEAERPFMRSNGLSILVRKGNPLGVSGLGDVFRDDVRLAISNPVTETASFSVYERVLLETGVRQGHDRDVVRAYLRSDAVAKSSVIHHREIPQILASGRADASVVYHHLALRYARIFPDVFDLLPIDLIELPGWQSLITHYHAARVGDGGAYGQVFLDFVNQDAVAEIYRAHGLAGPHDTF